MFWNIYFGTSLTVTGIAPKKIPVRVTENYRQFLATNFKERAKTIAQQIMLKEPDIIGLEEAALWELIPPNAEPVVFDFIDILLHDLEYLGYKYKLAVQNWNADVTLPDSLGNKIRLADRNGILLRESSGIEIIKRTRDNFKTNLEVVIGRQKFIILNGWSAIDACINGCDFRVVTSHLDPISPKVRLAQTIELLKGPGASKLPVILGGDFNEDANGSKRPIYKEFLNAGFNDVWVEAGKGSGFTCCQAHDLLNAASLLSRRIDWILFRNKENWDVLNAELVGEFQSDRTKTRLWPSDHAGITADLKLKFC